MGRKTDERIKTDAFNYGQRIAIMVKEQHETRGTLPLSDLGRTLLPPLPDPMNVTRYTRGMHGLFKEYWLKGYQSVYPDAEGE